MISRESELGVEFVDVGVKEFISRFHAGHACQPHFDWQARLQGFKHPLHAPFCLWDAAVLNMGAKLLAGICKLCAGVFLDVLRIFLFVSEYGSPVREELVRDSVFAQDLREHAVVTLKGLLVVEAGAGDPSCRIVYGDVQGCLSGAKPFVGLCVHLFQFAEVSASWVPCVRVLHSHDIGLYFICFLLCLGGFFLPFQLFLYPPLF